MARNEWRSAVKQANAALTSARDVGSSIGHGAAAQRVPHMYQQRLATWHEWNWLSAQANG